jgi:hypothetical protein
MLPIVAGPEPEFLTVSSPWTRSCPLTVAVFVALMVQVTVLPDSDPVLVSDQVALLVSEAEVAALESEILAFAGLAIATSLLDRSFPVEQAANRTTGRNRVTAAI